MPSRSPSHQLYISTHHFNRLHCNAAPVPSAHDSTKPVVPRNFSYPTSLSQPLQKSLPEVASPDARSLPDAQIRPYLLFNHPEATRDNIGEAPPSGATCPPHIRSQKRKRSGIFQGAELKRFLNFSIRRDTTTSSNHQVQNSSASSPDSDRELGQPSSEAEFGPLGHNPNTSLDLSLFNFYIEKGSLSPTYTITQTHEQRFDQTPSNKLRWVPSMRKNDTMADRRSCFTAAPTVIPPSGNPRSAHCHTNPTQSNSGTSINGDDYRTDHPPIAIEPPKAQFARPRWLTQVKDWLSVSEPSAQAMKQQRMDTYKRHGVDMNDPQAASKLRLPSGKIPAGATTSTSGPSPEKALLDSLKHKQKRQSYSGWSQTTHSISSTGSYAASIKDGNRTAPWETR